MGERDVDARKRIEGDTAAGGMSRRRFLGLSAMAAAAGSSTLGLAGCQATESAAAAWAAVRS